VQLLGLAWLKELYVAGVAEFSDYLQSGVDLLDTFVNENRLRIQHFVFVLLLIVFLKGRVNRENNGLVRSYDLGFGQNVFV